jgi:hypothetical protein
MIDADHPVLRSVYQIQASAANVYLARLPPRLIVSG